MVEGDEAKVRETGRAYEPGRAYERGLLEKGKLQPGFEPGSATGFQRQDLGRMSWLTEQ